MNERLQADAAMMLEALSEQMRGIAEIQRDRARLTATATACDKRISVTVNADGILIETRFADDISDLSYGEIAAAVTQAVQAAAKNVSQQGHRLMEPLRERKDRLPHLSDLVEGMPDFRSVIPAPQPVSTAPPNSPERRYDDEDSGFGDTEPVGRRSMVRDHHE
ncbi:YbaB/EbfC family nucleoid-associated protein [Nocardia pseudobrasiliensis]|uniref:YbaB/EbfC DNA-binding family protein n=1 Tax=Nocardia pseudobrasiliensis TaxID=45979 RepID=A0A370IBW0_9NOCA|nr:YbaB/EbfC family nucleoid-associated protein [Nocardia pseudobrasiliensis]RDI68219.1 YbaB/EbfC DNA-binding family protein [Nocardia pseudobrasiliensis]